MQQPSDRVARLRSALERAVDTTATVEQIGDRIRITAVVGPGVTPEQYSAALELVRAADVWGGSVPGEEPVIWAEFNEGGQG
jgi:hypothetical protein